MNNRDFVSNNVFLFLCILSFAFLLFPFSVNAQEPDQEEETDILQDERLNSLELRLEELGYTINEMQGILEQVQTSELSQEQERLAISGKLDLVIISLNDLINHDLEFLSKEDAQEILTLEYRQQMLEALAGLGETTVSGNILLEDIRSGIESVSTYEKEADILNNENEDTRFLLFVGVLGIGCGCILSLSVSNWFKRRI